MDTEVTPSPEHTLALYWGICGIGFCFVLGGERTGREKGLRSKMAKLDLSNSHLVYFRVLGSRSSITLAGV